MQIFGRVAEDFPGFGGDAGGVGVCVVQSGQGGGDAAGEAGREGCGDGVKGVGCCQDHCITSCRSARACGEQGGRKGRHEKRHTCCNETGNDESPHILRPHDPSSTDGAVNPAKSTHHTST